jgi:hypothetical protein
MTIIMDDSKVTNVKQIKSFLNSSKDIQFKGLSRESKYTWINKILDRFKYYALSKKDKGFVRKYIMRITGLSKAQITRLIDTKLKEGHIKTSMSGKRGFRTIYGSAEKELLAETDNLHERLSGPATKRILERQYDTFNDKRFELLKNISSSHIYNLRASKTYQTHSVTVGKTKSVQSSIGVRRKPEPRGEPGYLRVDTVHQGDRDGEKGVYHINLVDEILQWEIVISVEAINEANLITTLKIALFCFPVILRNFHSDNGSEFINKNIAKMLNRLLIEQTKSRSNKTNDNALAEGKNGSVIRKHMGHWHIERRHADKINRFFLEYFNHYLNYHRPCGFATVTVNERGKRRKKYDTWMTPYERLKSLKNAERYLKPGITFRKLDAIALKYTDNEFAKIMQDEKRKLFNSIMSVNDLKLLKKGEVIQKKSLTTKQPISGSFLY